MASGARGEICVCGSCVCGSCVCGSYVEMPLDPTQMAPGKGQQLRALTANDQPQTHMLKLAKPQFPEVCFGEALARRPTLRYMDPRLAPPQEAVNFSAASEPPPRPYPARKLAAEPWGSHGADFRRAVDVDLARRKQNPSPGRLPVAQMRAIIAGELAGAWKSSGASASSGQTWRACSRLDSRSA